MRALLITSSGQPEHVSLQSATLDEAYDEFKTLFPASRDVEMHDVYVACGEVGGTRECVCVFCDTFRGLRGRNPFFQGKTRPVFGAVLAVWTRVALDDTATCDDTLLDRHLTTDQLVRYLQAFEDNLTSFVRRVSGPNLAFEYELFPTIYKMNRGRKSWYNLNGVNLTSGSTKRSKVDAMYDVDLLTHHFKWRTYITSYAFPENSLYVKALVENYRYRFCVSCSRSITLRCSRCKQYYWCGGAGCKDEAWRVHRIDCVEQ